MILHVWTRGDGKTGAETLGSEISNQGLEHPTNHLAPSPRLVRFNYRPEQTALVQGTARGQCEGLRQEGSLSLWMPTLGGTGQNWAWPIPFFARRDLVWTDLCASRMPLS